MNVSDQVRKAPLVAVLALIAAVCPIPLHSMTIGPTTVMGLATSALCVLALATVCTAPLLPVRHVHAAALLFLLWAFVRTALAGVDGFAMQNLAVYVLFFGVLLATGGAAMNPRVRDRLMLLLKHGATVLVLAYAIQVVIAGPGSDLLIEPRAFALTAVAALAGTWMVPHGSRRGELLWCGWLLLVIGASLSRTALALGLVVFFLRVFSFDGRIKIGRVLVSIVGALGGLYWLTTNVPLLRERFTTGDIGARVGGMPLNVMGRDTLWRVTISSAEEAPWLGHGVGASGRLMDELGWASHPHNDYLRLWNDLGWVGVVAFVVVLVSLAVVCVRLLRSHDTAPAGLAMLAGIVVMAGSMVTDNTIVYPQVMGPLAVVFGCAAAALPAVDSHPSPSRAPVAKG